jgi:hypothetical protein
LAEYLELERRAELVGCELIRYFNKEKKDLCILGLLFFFRADNVGKYTSTGQYQVKLVPFLKLKINHSSGFNSLFPSLIDRTNLLNDFIYIQFERCATNNITKWFLGPKGQVRASGEIKGRGLFSYLFSRLIIFVKENETTTNWIHKPSVSLSHIDASSDEKRLSRNNFYIRLGFDLSSSSGFTGHDVISGMATATFDKLNTAAVQLENIESAAISMESDEFKSIIKEGYTGKLGMDTAEWLDREKLGHISQSAQKLLEFYDLIKRLDESNKDFRSRNCMSRRYLSSRLIETIKSQEERKVALEHTLSLARAENAFLNKVLDIMEATFVESNKF